MIFVDTMEDGRYYTKSDRYKIMQTNTGRIYEDAIDVFKTDYVETSIELQEYGTKHYNSCSEWV